jgi:hypothetical protein
VPSAKDVGTESVPFRSRRLRRCERVADDPHHGGGGSRETGWSWLVLPRRIDPGKYSLSGTNNKTVMEFPRVQRLTIL